MLTRKTSMPAEKKSAEFRTFLRETLVYHAVDFMWILIFMLYPPPDIPFIFKLRSLTGISKEYLIFFAIE